MSDDHATGERAHPVLHAEAWSVTHAELVAGHSNQGLEELLSPGEPPEGATRAEHVESPRRAVARPRSMASFPGAALAMQGSVGNRAVARTLQRTVGNGVDERSPGVTVSQGPMVQRWTNPVVSLKDDAQLISDGLAGDVEAIKHISHYDSAIDSAKLGLIKVLLDNGGVWGRNSTALEGLWAAFGTRLPDKAGENIALWERSVALDKDLKNLAPIKDLQTKFIADVKKTASQYLDDNEKTVNKEVASLGGNKDDQAAGDPSVDQRVKVAEVQEGAKKLARAREAMKGLELVPVGTEIVGEGGVDETAPLTFQQVLQDGGPPGAETNGGKKTYDVPRFHEIMGQYAVAQAVLNGLMLKYPALVGVEGGGSDPAALADVAVADPDKARTSVLEALHRTREHIASTREKLDGDLPYELQPIHQQLTSGKVKGTTDWSQAFNKSLAKATVSAYEEHQFWVELGLTTLAAASFVVAEIATGGMATFFAGFAVGVGMGQAAGKWAKAKELSDAAQASLNPEQQLVASGQAEAAGFDAMLSTVFAFIDLKMASGVFAKVGKLAELAKIGEMSAAQAKPLLEKAIADYGVEAVSKSSGRNAAELLKIVGEESPVAARLKALAEAARVPVPQGLETATSLGAAATKAAKTRGMGLIWTLMTKEQRAAKLLEIVNERLVANGIPPIRKDVIWAASKGGGFFNFPTWKLAISESAMKAWVHTDADFAKLIETAYHEARHCEQWFAMARLRAAWATVIPGESATTLAAQLGIPIDIADAAMKMPMKLGSSEAAEAAKWWESVYGTGAAARKAVYDELDAVKKEVVGGTLKVTDKRYLDAVNAYKALPEEADAWKVGSDAASAYTKAMTP